MKLRNILLLAIAACVCTAAPAQKKTKVGKKAKTTKTVKAAELTPARVQPIGAADFSYAAGVGQSQSLRNYLMQREGVDSAYLEYAAQAMIEAAQLSPEAQKQLMARAAGLRIVQMNREQVVPQFNQAATGVADTTYTDLQLLNKGLADGIMGRATLTPDSAMKLAERQFEYQQQCLQQAGADFLAANAKKKGVKVTPSGLQYMIIKEGKGAVAADTTEVEVHYEGRLIDGKVFDSSYQRGQTATFRPNQVIKGWTEALTTLPEGTVAELYIPWNLGYGQRGSGQNIPPYATLIFKLEIIKVNPAAKK